VKGATALVRPLRLRILEQLAEPDSAAGIARRLDVPRQKVNYHLKELEQQGLVELVDERKKGNCVERVVRATARSYFASADALAQLLGSRQGLPAEDRFSSTYLVAVLARALSELAHLRELADAAGKRLATFTLQTDIRFADAAARKAFFEELAAELARLTAKYHNAQAPHGRWFRLFVGAHTAPPKETSDDQD
jgi:DNA-binding transcriptional ArsR family regulator